MKLHWSPRSPFVRKVMIVAHEVGIADRLTLVRNVVAMSEVNAAVSADNPLNKLPTLVCDDGLVLFDSRVICRYFDAENRLHPSERSAGVEADRRQAAGDGLLDLLILLRNERERPEGNRSPVHMAAWAAKIDNSLDWLERQVSDFAPRPFDIGHIAIGCALGYLDFRFAALDWRSGRPALARWAAAFEARPSAQATAVPAH